MNSGLRLATKICYDYLFLKAQSFPPPSRSQFTKSADKYPGIFPRQLVFIYIFYRKEATELFKNIKCFMFHVPCLVPYDCWQGVALSELYLLGHKYWSICMWEILATGLAVYLNPIYRTLTQQRWGHTRHPTTENYLEGGRESFSWFAWNSEQIWLLLRLHDLKEPRKWSSRWQERLLKPEAGRIVTKGPPGGGGGIFSFLLGGGGVVVVLVWGGGGVTVHV